MPKINCDSCGKEFWHRPSRMKEKNYCSRECGQRARNPVVECASCGEAFRRPQSEAKKKRSQFCSRKCYRAAIGQHKWTSAAIHRAATIASAHGIAKAAKEVGVSEQSLRATFRRANVDIADFAPNAPPEPKVLGKWKKSDLIQFDRMFQRALAREGRDFRGYGFYLPHNRPRSDAMEIWLLKNKPKLHSEAKKGVRAMQNEQNGTISGKIVATCCLKHDVTLEEFWGQRRVRRITKARQEAAYLARLAGMSYTQIAKHVTKSSDHTTVMYGARVHAERNNLPSPDRDAFWKQQRAIDERAKSA